MVIYIRDSKGVRGPGMGGEESAREEVGCGGKLMLRLCIVKNSNK